MKIEISSPTRAYLIQYDEMELFDLRKALSYTNTGVQHLIKRHYANHFWKSRNVLGWQAHLDELQKDLKRCLVFQDGERFYIRPGSIPYLTSFKIEVENKVVYPTPKRFLWKNPLPFELHEYQNDSSEKLPIEKHGNVSLTTGSGKSGIIINLCKNLGLDAVIVVPSKSIFEELVEKFEYHFGSRYVGTFGAGKKKLGKKFTIAIGDSLANIEPGSEEDIFFRSREVLLVDESHEFAAESLEQVCHGTLEPIPYRFFFSATQIRNDGSGPLLQSIIGRTVRTLTTAEAVRNGYICYHDFRIVSIESSNPGFTSQDPLELKREHFLKNRNIASFCAKLANGMAAQGRGTLILVEELSQISMLIPLLKEPFVIAHSEKRKERIEALGIHKVDNAESVEKFNRGEAKIIVGTSCIATGTNIFPCHNVINWRGGSSPIKTKQGAVGRAVRFGRSNPWAKNWTIPKEKATIYDFDIEDDYVMGRHLESRLECYKESETEIKYIRLKI